MNGGFSVEARADGVVAIQPEGPDEFGAGAEVGARASARAARAPLVSYAHDERARIAVVLLGRLHYRDDLLARLSGRAGLAGASDASLVLALFSQAGRRGLEDLEGSFALVVHDANEGRLFAQRDPLGAWPLYWIDQGQGSSIVLSTSLEALVTRQPGRSFDIESLARFLIQPFPGAELPGEQTVYSSIRRVVPGTIVGFDAAGRVTRYPYWDWTARIESHGALSIDIDAAGDRFLDLFRQAVRQRLGTGAGPVAAHLSGGMDSSGVACVARDWIAEGAKAGPAPAPLSTLTMAFAGGPLAGERAYAELVVRQGGPIAPHFLPADSALAFAWFDRPIPAHDEPYGGLFGLASEELLVDAADRAGAATVLTGLGSDEILEGDPSYLADLVRQGHWRTAWQGALAWAEARNQGLTTVLCRHVLEPLLPWPERDWHAIPPWIRPEFARKTAMKNLAAEQARVPRRSRALLALGNAIGDWSGWYLAAPRGIQIAHPFRDVRLIGFALGVPAALKAIPGRRKPLLATALRGVLPEAIRLRREKRGFNDLYGRGLVKHLQKLEELVETSPLISLGIIDPPVLIEALHRAAAGVGTAIGCTRINQTLALSAWLDQTTTRRTGTPSSAGAGAGHGSATSGRATTSASTTHGFLRR
jgi:asparagine synthase (glutamine-hydrolysing)